MNELYDELARLKSENSFYRRRIKELEDKCAWVERNGWSPEYRARLEQLEAAIARVKAISALHPNTPIACEIDRDMHLRQIGWSDFRDELNAALALPSKALGETHLQRAEKAEAALAVIPPDKLELLADWLDMKDAEADNTNCGVQTDLREMARLSRAALRHDNRRKHEQRT